MSDDPAALQQPQEPGTAPWWRRSPPLAAAGCLAIGVATLWFANMLNRVPLDRHAPFSYLLMLPLLLIVPAFSAAGLRLAWSAFSGASGAMAIAIRAGALAGAVANLYAIVRFVAALLRIFAG